MAFSITSRFNILATTQISLTLTTNPSRREHMTPPFPEFPLGSHHPRGWWIQAPNWEQKHVPQMLWTLRHGLASCLSLPHLPAALMGSQCKCPHLSRISLLKKEGTTAWCIYFLLTPLPWSCGATCPRRSQACRFWFTIEHSCSWLWSWKSERKQIHSSDMSACKWCFPCPNRWEYMTLHIPWGLRIIFLIIFVSLNNGSGWLAATLCNVQQMRQHLLVLS